MKRLFSVILLLALAIVAPTTQAYTKHVVPKGKRTLYVVGPITSMALLTANTIERLSNESKEDINIVINSPGGVVFAGLQLTQAMDIARERGVKVVCTVGVMAASMAFQMLPHCSERYALKNTLLLFHPSRVFMRGELSATDAGLIAESLRKTDLHGLKEIAEMMGPPSAAWLKRHHDGETLWRAEDLVNETQKDWLNLVDDIVVPGGVFNIFGSDGDSKEDAVRKELNRFRWITVN